jgi:putative tryptophan/tyrosine transport system substrate-binding protein
LLKELVPTAIRYAVLVNPSNPDTDSILAELRFAATSIGKTVDVFKASNVREIDVAFAELASRGVDALVVGASSLFPSRAVQLATLAAHHRLPAIYYDSRIAKVGGLMSYGANINDSVRQGGGYVGRVLKGAKPSELPVIQSAKFELVLNLQTARTLGLVVPPTLLAIADEVIE